MTAVMKEMMTEKGSRQEDAGKTMVVTHEDHSSESNCRLARGQIVF